MTLVISDIIFVHCDHVPDSCLLRSNDAEITSLFVTTNHHIIIEHVVCCIILRS